MAETMLSRLQTIAGRNEERASRAGRLLKFADNNSVDILAAELKSKASLDSIERDPYWPKWDSPWWKMLLLAEMNLADRIPVIALEAMAASIKKHYLSYFPLTESELPEGCDPYRDIICHCAYGCVYRIFHSAGKKSEEIFPEALKWFIKYQLPDGGLNCDESVYAKSSPASSFLSTLPPLEALLHCTRRNFNEEEISFLERGNQYLIRRKLFRSLRKAMAPADPEFTKLIFPRYYEYDILRGLHFVVRFAVAFNKPLPVSAIIEAVEIIDSKVDNDGLLHVERNIFAKSKTIMPKDDGTWAKSAPAPVFPLLEKMGDVGSPSIFLSLQWYDVIYGIIHLDRLGLLSGSLADRLIK